MWFFRRKKKTFNSLLEAQTYYINIIFDLFDDFLRKNKNQEFSSIARLLDEFIKSEVMKINFENEKHLDELYETQSQQKIAPNFKSSLIVAFNTPISAIYYISKQADYIKANYGFELNKKVILVYLSQALNDFQKNLSYFGLFFNSKKSCVDCRSEEISFYSQFYQDFESKGCKIEGRGCPFAYLISKALKSVDFLNSNCYINDNRIYWGDLKFIEEVCIKKPKFLTRIK